MLSERENISIASLAIYIPFLFLSIYVCIRHGFVRQLGWLYLVIFCVLRIASGILGILSAKHPSNRTDATWSAILGSIGLTPLLLAASGLLKRINDHLTGKAPLILALRILNLPILTGLILAIIGGTKLSSTSPTTQSSGRTYQKAAGILYLIGYIGLFTIPTITSHQLRMLPRGEKRILYAVLAALPLLAVRLLYTLICAFAHSRTFGANVPVKLCMATVEEMLVTVLFLVVGVMAPPVMTGRRKGEEDDRVGMELKPERGDHRQRG